MRRAINVCGGISAIILLGVFPFAFGYSVIGPLADAQPAPSSPDFQASYDAIIKQLSTDYAVSQAQVFADQRELAKLAAVEKERDELKAKLAESAAIRGSTSPKQ